MSEPILHKCQICGRLFAISNLLEEHAELHRSEEFQRKLAVQKKLDDQWYADHPSWLMQLWKRLTGRYRFK